MKKSKINKIVIFTQPVGGLGGLIVIRNCLFRLPPPPSAFKLTL